MLLVEHPTVFISRNVFGSPECLVMFLMSTLEKAILTNILNICSVR